MEDEYKEFLAALGARIRQMRKERGWSLRDMVISHDYHDSQWRKYESGGGLTIPSLLRIASMFSVSISQLLDGLGVYPRQPVEALDLAPEVLKAAKRVVALGKPPAGKGPPVRKNA